MAKRCVDCPEILQPQIGRGRPRIRCPQCSVKRRGKSLTVAPTPLGPPPGPESPLEALTGLAAGVRAELEAAGRADSVDGMAAIHAAETLDRQDVSGAARASLLREMRTAAADALRAAAPAGGVLDELRRRRDQKSG